KQQPARARRIGAHVRGRGGKRRDVRADQHQLAVLDDDVRLFEVRATAPNRLHFPAFERDPGLETFLDKIVVERLAILDNAHGTLMAGSSLARAFYPRTRWAGGVAARSTSCVACAA